MYKEYLEPILKDSFKSETFSIELNEVNRWLNYRSQSYLENKLKHNLTLNKEYILLPSNTKDRFKVLLTIKGLRVLLFNCTKKKVAVKVFKYLEDYTDKILNDPQISLSYLADKLEQIESKLSTNKVNKKALSTTDTRIPKSKAIKYLKNNIGVKAELNKEEFLRLVFMYSIANDIRTSRVLKLISTKYNNLYSDGLYKRAVLHTKGDIYDFCYKDNSIKKLTIATYNALWTEAQQLTAT